jgi:hypothetical protein
MMPLSVHASRFLASTREAWASTGTISHIEGIERQAIG